MYIKTKKEIINFLKNRKCAINENSVEEIEKMNKKGVLKIITNIFEFSISPKDKKKIEEIVHIFGRETMEIRIKKGLEV